jgi:carboxylesterase type B
MQVAWPKNIFAKQLTDTTGPRLILSHPLVLAQKTVSFYLSLHLPMPRTFQSWFGSVSPHLNFQYRRRVLKELLIDGGGYGTGQGNGDLSELIMTNSHGFIAVIIQYRLGAFGFLSSAELANYGIPNVGLYDQQYSLEWVQKYIHSFGGDPSRVTISGESAGGGAVMLQVLANGGTLGTSLFNNAIVASPYLPQQWEYDGIAPSQSYYLFAQAAGCLGLGTSVGVTETVFSCLQNAETLVLQNASAYVSAGGKYGQWAFLPVTDGTFLQKRPSEQLLAGEVNGLRILSGVHPFLH